MFDKSNGNRSTSQLIQRLDMTIERKAWGQRVFWLLRNTTALIQGMKSYKAE